MIQFVQYGWHKWMDNLCDNKNEEYKDYQIWNSKALVKEAFLN